MNKKIILVIILIITMATIIGISIYNQNKKEEEKIQLKLKFEPLKVLNLNELHNIPDNQIHTIRKLIEEYQYEIKIRDGKKEQEFIKSLVPNFKELIKEFFKEVTKRDKEKLKKRRKEVENNNYTKYLKKYKGITDEATIKQKVERFRKNIDNERDGIFGDITDEEKKEIEEFQKVVNELDD